MLKYMQTKREECFELEHKLTQLAKDMEVAEGLQSSVQAVREEAKKYRSRGNEISEWIEEATGIKQ